MPKTRRIKPRYYVTLNRDNVELVYLRHGPRSLSPLIDRLLERHLKEKKEPATTTP